MLDGWSILVVDGEAAGRDFIGDILGAAGWQVDEAESGDAAVAATRKRRYDLILMNLQMPGRDGIEAAREIRGGHGPGAGAPILAITIASSGNVIARIRAAGMDDYVTSPLTTETLLAATDRWRPDGAPPPAASLAPIFGAAEIATLLARFRSQLADALAADDTEDERKVRAHKIAGISGTLGFADVSSLWLAVSEGDDAAWGEARIAARQAIRRIDSSDDPSISGSTT